MLSFSSLKVIVVDNYKYWQGFNQNNYDIDEEEDVFTWLC